MDESKETRSKLIKPGSNPPILLQFIEEAFYQMPFLVQKPVTVPGINGIGFRGNTETSIPVGNVLPEIIGAIRLIGQHGCFIRFQIYVVQNVFRNDRIMDIAGG